MSITSIPSRFNTQLSALPPFEFWDDFNDEYAAGPVTGTSPWISTLLSSGTASQASTAADQNCGVIILGGAATTDNSGAQIQADMQYVQMVAGKHYEYRVRHKMLDGTQDEFFSGIAIADTTLCDGTGTLAGGLTHTDSIGFYKPDGGTLLYGVVRGASVQLATGGISYDPTTFHDMWWKLDVKSSDVTVGDVAFYLDGAEIGRLHGAIPLNSVFLSPAHAFVTGDNLLTKTNTVDYIGCLIERG